MDSPLQKLVGLTVTRAEQVHDYAQLAFGGSIGVSIYNEYSLVPKKLDIGQLVGAVVTLIAEDDYAIAFSFLGSQRLVIDMHRQAYRGPEALELNERGFPTVVWN